MFKKAAIAAVLMFIAVQVHAQAANNDEAAVRDFIAHWNAAYTGLDSKALAALETDDYEMIDRFGHWIRSEGPEFNRRLWELGFREVYRGKAGPAREIESIRFMAPGAAVVQARANHPDGVSLDDGTHIPPFWEINTYTLIRTGAGWKVALLNIHNQIDPEAEGAGQHVPNTSAANGAHH